LGPVCICSLIGINSKGLTRLRPKAEGHIIALGITTAPWNRHAQEHKEWDQKVYDHESSCMPHTSSPWICSSSLWYKYPEEDRVMRMILYGCLLTLALVCHPVIAVGDEQSHRKAAENLLLVMEIDKALPKIVDQVVANQLQQNPQLAPQHEVLQRF